jgi:hypothetical protein
VECKKSVQGRFALTVAKELSQYKLDLVGVQEVRWVDNIKIDLREIGWNVMD